MENCPFCDAPGSYREATDGSCYVCGMMLPNQSGQNEPRVATQVMEHSHDEDEAPKEVQATEKRDIPNSERDEPTVVVEPSRAAPTVFMESSGPPAIDLIHPRNLSPEYARRVTAAWEVTKSPFKNPLETINAKMSAQAAAENLLIGTRTVSRSEEEGRADYRLNEVIGQGAMGTVWSARQGSLDREVAIKMPRPSSGDSSFGRQLFISEVVVTGQLDHPNIVPIYDLARDESGQLFYAMKRVEGRSWDMCMHEEGRTRHDNVEILMKVCDAVRFAHDRKVLHRDIKPQNIMVGKFGEVSVMDWGIALKLPEGTQIPGMTKISPSGTPAYMAPEMATGNANEIGWHTDVYLLGAVLYEIITGEPPHPAPSGTSDMVVQQKACLLIAARNVITPAKETGELIDIAYRAMATDVYDRYPTVDEFQAAIRSYFEHAESIALTERGDKHLTNAREARNGVYEDFAKARFAFDEAIQLWPQNSRARHGLSEATHDYAGSALDRGDYALGLSLLRDDDPAHTDLAKQLRSAKRKQERNRFVASASLVAAVLSLAAGLGVSYYFYRGEANTNKELIIAQGDKVAAEKDAAAAAKKKKEAEEGLTIAEKKVKDSEKQLTENQKKLEVAVVQANAADKKVADAKVEAENAKRVRDDQVKLANKAKAEAEQTKYGAEIKRVADDIQHNSFPDALAALGKLESDDKGKSSSLRNWEWGHLKYQAAEPSISRFPVDGSPSINSVAISPDQKWFAAAADDKNVYVWRSGSDKPPLSKKQDSKVSAVVITADSKTLVVAAGDMVSFYALTLDEQDGQLASAGKPLHYVADEKDIHLDSPPQFRSVALSPVDPNIVLTSTDDKKAQLWSRKSPAKPIRTLKGHLSGPVWQARFSPDGKLIATAGNDGSVRLWNPETDDTRPLDGHRGPVYAVEFSPDGKTLVSGGRDRRLLVWNVPSLPQLHASADGIRDRLKDAQETQQSTEFRPLGEHTSAVQCLSFSPDGKTLFSGSDDNSLSVWDTNPKATTAQLKSLRGHGESVRGCVAVGDGQRVLSGSHDGRVFLWDWKNYAFPLVLRPESTRQLRLTSAAASPDARWIATAAEDGLITMWNMSDPLRPTSQSLVEGHDLQATTGVFFQNGQRLLTAGGDNSALIWDATSGNQLVRLGGWNATTGTGWRGVGAASHDQDGKWIATGSNDKAILAMIWNAKTGALEHSLVIPKEARAEEGSEAAAIVFAPDDQTVFVGAQSGRGYMFRTKDGSFIREKQLNGHDKKINAALYLPNGHLLTASSDRTVIEWDLGSPAGEPQPVRRLLHGDRVVSMDRSSDGNLLVTVADSLFDDKVLRLWDMRTGKEVQSLTLAQLVDWRPVDRDETRQKKEDTNHLPAVRSVAFNSEKQQALVTLYDPKDSKYRVGTWSWANAQPAVQWIYPSLRDTSMAAYSPIQKGSILTVGGRGARVRLANNQVVTNFRPQAGVQSVGFSPNGEMLASASKDGSIKLWRFDAAKNLWMANGTLLGHNGSVNSVAFHPKQNDLLLSAGNDGTVRLWRPAGGAWTSTTLQNAGGDSGPVRQAIFSPLDKNGACDIFAAAGDKVNVWNSDGKPLRSLLVKQQVQCLAVSPKREWLVAGVGNQAWVYKQDAVEGEPVQKLPGHTAEITALVFSNEDGERLFTAGRNRQVKVWDALSWATADPKQPASHELLTLEQHKDSVVSLSLFPSAKFPALLSAGADGQAILWRYVPWNKQ